MENQQNAPEGFTLLPKENFTGIAWLKMRVEPDDVTDCYVGEVMFEPGSRNNWHRHPSNQILAVIEGAGYFQAEGSPIREIRTGDVINILPNTKHWHGATPNGRLVHYAININTELGIAEWLEPVTDEQYNDLKR